MSGSTMDANTPKPLYKIAFELHLGQVQEMSSTLHERLTTPYHTKTSFHEMIYYNRLTALINISAKG